MWDDGRGALAALDLPNRRRILDVGCGTGELTRVLADEAAGATVVGVDADRGLLRVARERTGLECLAGDATRLPAADGAVDLAVCQALLVNLPAPREAVAELARVSSGLVAAIEPDNAAVEVESTVPEEATVEREARAAYIEGAATDVALGAGAAAPFRAAGLADVETARYRHEKRIEPPYSEAALADARRKATGAGLDDHPELTRALSTAEYDDLRRRWRAVGRAVVAGMAAGDYERREVVPFAVTVGRA